LKGSRLSFQLGLAAIINEVFRGFPHSRQSNTLIVATSMEQNPSLERNSRTAGQEMLRLLPNPKVR
jgi:hypothetical protein